ncbi:hypothetical protein BY996DRAFT_7623351 [Phakopsora pachyrhizi]|uniref:Large ribosomal subunit protein uL30m n=1 Tax=Phakopsora pachyrhizi TaxID=170000 RepID=A0AAV0ATH0_PHAPC|nr:hypothetical protein BY996DRAFT_7623351 [Phakopsora pachyrhizi]CAH7672087.1 hypothetical protein PPACK8108_LOCUS6868 [Phakopsora pachyrhizi]
MLRRILDISSTVMRITTTTNCSAHFSTVKSRSMKSDSQKLISQSQPSTSAGLEPEPEKRTHYRITLYRSPIGLSQRSKDSLASLGLKRRMDVVYQRHSPDAAGLILSVKEILKVENVTGSEMRMGLKSSRRLKGEDRGYRVLRNLLHQDQ